VTNLQDAVGRGALGRHGITNCQPHHRPGHHRQTGDRRHALQRHHRLDDQPQPDFAEINQGQGTIGKLVNDQEFYKNAKLTLQNWTRPPTAWKTRGR
jgi:hypothetical protein